MIHLYGLIVGIAIVVGWSVAEKLEPKIGKIAPWVILGGLIGARLWHVIEMWEYYSQDLLTALQVWNGGMSIWGGLLGGVLVLSIMYYVLRWEKKIVMRMLRVIVTVLPLSQAIGRIANGVNGEFTNLILGIPWWGMEAILDLILFGLIWITPKKWRVGMYLVCYGLIRLVLEPYRRVE